MREPPERRELLGADARRRRGGIFTCWSQPRSDAARVEVVDLGDALLQLVRTRVCIDANRTAPCRGRAPSDSHARMTTPAFAALELASDGSAPSVVALRSEGGSVLVRRRIQDPVCPRHRRAPVPREGGGRSVGRAPPPRSRLATAGCHGSRRAPASFRRRRWTEAFVLGGSHLAASSRSGSVGWRRRSRATSCSRSGSRSSAPVACERADRLELLLRGAARAHEVRVVGVREPVRLGARRGDDRRAPRARAPCRPRPRRSSTASIASQPLRVGDGVAAAVEDAEARRRLRRRRERRNSAPSERGRAQLEVRRARARERAAAEQRAAEVGAAAAGAADHALRRPLERRVPRVEDARLDERRERARRRPSTCSW